MIKKLMMLCVAAMAAMGAWGHFSARFKSPQGMSEFRERRQ